MMNFMGTKIKRQQLVEQVIEHLEKAINSGDFTVGTKLPTEPRLMDELGVGRSTLREAIRVLAHGGILEVRQGDGTYVRSLLTTDEPLARRLRRARLREVQEVRRTLEIEIVRLAAERRQESDVARMRGRLKLRQEAVDRGDLSAALDADMAFHSAIAEAAGNAVFADLYRTFSRTLQDALAVQWEIGDSGPSETAGLHERLLDAIATGNAAEAVAITITLLDRHDASVKMEGGDER